VAGRHRQPIAGGHHPVGVRPRGVGVEVDHLGLEPQAELHAEFFDLVDQGVQAVGPDVLGDPPVAQSGEVVAAGTEPAVVEDVALDADCRGLLGQLDQRLEAVVEVDRLPHVDRDRTLRRRMTWSGPQVPVEPACDLVQPGAVGAVQPRRGVGLALAQGDLAGQQQLAPADHLLARRQPFGVVGVIAAPAEVDPPHLALGEGERGRARVEHGRRVGTGPPLATLAQVHPHREVPALGGALPAPPAGEVEQFAGHHGHRVGDHQVVEGVRLGRGVGQPRLGAQHSAGGELDRQAEGQVRNLVHRVHLHRARPALDQGRSGGAGGHLLTVQPQRGRREPR